VGIRDKYIKEANEKMEGLEIYHKFTGEVMYIPANKIQSSIVARSEKPVEDKFSGEKHFLVYFNWRPTSKQKSLLDYEKKIKKKN